MATSVRKKSDMDADKVKFRGTGIRFTASPGVTTIYDHILTEGRLLDGAQIVPQNHVHGDSVRLQVVDVNNILGYGAGVVLDEFATNWYMIPGASYQGQLQLEYSAEIIAGLALRIIYNSVGAQPVDFCCNLFLHKYLV